MERKYKYIDEHNIKQCPLVIENEENNRCYANPPVDIQKQYGYDRDFEDCPYPETKEGYYRDFTYSDTNPIQKVWSEPIKIDEVEE